ADLFDNGTVNLGVLTGHFKADLFLGLGGEISRNPRELTEQSSHRQKSCLHDQILKVFGYPADVAACLSQTFDNGLQVVTFLQFLQSSSEPGPVDYQFSYKIHQVVQNRNV